MEQLEKCPVCGNLHKRAYDITTLKNCKDYYYCSDCGYWCFATYSDYYKGIELSEGIEFIYSLKQIKLLLKNWKAARSCLDGRLGFKKCII